MAITVKMNKKKVVLYVVIFIIISCFVGYFIYKNYNLRARDRLISKTTKHIKIEIVDKDKIDLGEISEKNKPIDVMFFLEKKFLDLKDNVIELKNFKFGVDNPFVEKEIKKDEDSISY